jgi:hypothetical protein
MATVPSAHAAPGDADRSREREALFQQGVERAAAGDWGEAVERFREVVKIRSSPKALYTLGEAEEHAGQLVAARQSYLAALGAARTAGSRDVIDLATEALRRIDPRLPRISVRLDDRVSAAQANDARASIDGHSVALDSPIVVDPGDHEVRVEASQTPPFVRKVKLMEGQSIDVVVAALEPPPSTLPPPSKPNPEPVEASHHPSVLVPLVIGASGLALGVTGIILRVGGQSDYDTAAAQCPGSACSNGAVAAAGNDGRNRLILGTGLMAAGGVVLTGAGVYWLLSGGLATPVQAGTAVDGTGARLVLRGAF